MGQFDCFIPFARDVSNVLPDKSLQTVVFINNLGRENLVTVLVWAIVVLEEVVAHVQEAEMFEPHTLRVKKNQFH